MSSSRSFSQSSRQEQSTSQPLLDYLTRGNHSDNNNNNNNNNYNYNNNINNNNNNDNNSGGNLIESAPTIVTNEDLHAMREVNHLQIQILRDSLEEKGRELKSLREHGEQWKHCAMSQTQPSFSGISHQLLNLLMLLSAHLSMFLSHIYASMSLFLYQSIYLSISLFLSLTIYTYIEISFYLSGNLLIYLSISLSYLYIDPSMFQYTCFSSRLSKYR